MAKLSPETKRKLHEMAEKQATKIAHEFEEKMVNQYVKLLNWYYEEPYQTNPPHYKRTGNLKKSYNPYFNKKNNVIVSGIEITGENMNDYKPNFSGEDLLRGFFFIPGTPSVTWHGGDYHGGRGTMAGFSVAEEMYSYYYKTLKDFRKKYGI